MRYLAVFLFTVLGSVLVNAQTYEIGLYGGGANYIGDVGNSAFIAPNAPVAGAILKWNRSKRHSFRFSALYGQLKGDDADSNESRRQQRGLQFENNILEVSLGLEYTFWDFDLYNDRNPSTPYLYTGITAFNQDDLTILSTNQIESLGGRWDFAIPMVIGYKAAIGTKFILAFEIGARYAFSDNLDGSSPNLEATQFLSFGNLNNDDWYMFTGVSFTYTFGRKPCFCAF